MPKPKPDNIVRVELVMGTAERQIVRDLQTAYSINRIASPITNMSASGFVLAGGAALLLVDYILDSLGLDPNWREIIEDMTPEQVNDWLESQNLIFGGIGAIIGGLLTGGNPFGVAAGGVAGGVVVEGLEAADEAVASVFPEEWLPFLPPWAQPGGGGSTSADQEEQQQTSKRRFSMSLFGFRNFLRSRGE
jgi:hypothetical protein